MWLTIAPSCTAFGAVLVVLTGEAASRARPASSHPAPNPQNHTKKEAVRSLFTNFCSSHVAHFISAIRFLIHAVLQKAARDQLITFPGCFLNPPSPPLSLAKRENERTPLFLHCTHAPCPPMSILHPTQIAARATQQKIYQYIFLHHS